MINYFPTPQKRCGLLAVLSGPSGSGKTTLYQSLLKEDAMIDFSVSCTTRTPRENEKDGRDYYFLSEEDFYHKIAADEFLEYAEVHGKLYGTLRSEVENRLRTGRDVLLDIDVQGAEQVRRRARNTWLHSSVLSIFVLPPDMEQLRHRLSSRGTEDEKNFEKRLENAREELKAWQEYDYLIVNQDLQTAEQDLNAVIRAARLAVPLHLQEKTEIQ